MTTTTPRERPILFSGPMVRAILDGRKTQTRRIIKPQPQRCEAYGREEAFCPDAAYSREPGSTMQGMAVDPRRWWCANAGGPRTAHVCPYGQPGDRLWVRETWALENPPEDGELLIWQADRSAAWRSHLGERFRLAPNYQPNRWRPSIYMPRWASRLTLEVVSVRVERLHDISEEDAKAEGACEWGLENERHEEAWARWTRILDSSTRVGSARGAFAALWTSINGPKSWDANPWVWCVEFRRVETPHV